MGQARRQAAESGEKDEKDAEAFSSSSSSGEDAGVGVKALAVGDTEQGDGGDRMETDSNGLERGEEEEEEEEEEVTLPTEFVPLSALETAIMAADKINAHIDELEYVWVRNSVRVDGRR